MYELSGGNFFLIFSQNRVPQRVIGKITEAIGDHAIGLPGEKTFGVSPKGDFANTDLKFPYQPGLYNAIARVNADIIIGEGFFQWTPMALLRAKLTKSKFMIAYERTAHTERNCPKWRTLYRQMISRFVDGYSVNGQLTKEYLVEIGVNDQKIFVGGMSGDSEGLVRELGSFTINEQTELKSDLMIKGGLTYLYVGQLNERKGVIYLLEGWIVHIEKFPEDNLIIIGTGPLYELFMNTYSGFDSINMLGFVDYDLMYRYYAIAEVFVIPTLEDNWSLVVPEAMACGLPVACSIYNGCYPELVHEGINGKLFDPLRKETIVETLDYFHGLDLKAMGNESIRIEKEYDAGSVASKIYETCISIIK